MEMSLKEHNERKNRTYKMMLWFAMISMFMLFAGLTSAYVVSTSRPDWLKDFVLPDAFMISTLIIILSSVTFHMAKVSITKGDRQATSNYLIGTLLLGIAFVGAQFYGFQKVIDSGYYFTGAESTITTTFLYIVTIVHMVHVFAGIIVLLIVIYNHFKQKYSASQSLGIELGAMFWHFLDILWVYLFLFFYFY